MYTVRIPIHTSEIDERYFAKCFFCAWEIRNSVTAYAFRMLSALYADRAYRNAREEYGRKYSGLSADDVRRLSAPEKANRKRLVAVMNNRQLKYHLSKSALEKYAAVQQRKYTKYLFSHQVQAIAKNVYTGVEKVLYRHGKKLGFARYNDFDTIPQKDLSGVSLIDWNHIRYRKKVFRLKTPDTRYMQMVENAHQRIVLCALKRIEFESGWRYYVIVTLDGDPPVMQQKSSTPDRIGVDIGTSTFAAASGQKVMLANLAPYAVNYEKQIRHLQKQIDHKRRLLNPGNYNPDGTVKSGRKSWVLSKQIKRLQRKIRVLYRRRTAYIKSSHQTQINRLLDGVTEVIIEPMRFTALKKRSSKTERSEKTSTVERSDGSTVCVHKFKRKKRFGHSITNHSPGLFQSELKRKALKLDIPYFEIQTQKYKASQYHHDTGEYTSSRLNDRYKEIAGCTVQRDLYSAFLIAHTDNTLCHPDDAACDKDFPQFVTLHDHELSAMKASGVSNKACWGF